MHPLIIYHSGKKVSVNPSGSRISMLKMFGYFVLGAVLYKLLKRLFGGGGGNQGYYQSGGNQGYYRNSEQAQPSRPVYYYDVLPDYKNYYQLESTISPYYEYQHMGLYPEAHEINVDFEPRLESNIIKGSFNSVYHYLDIHFRLLREDFLRPLRQDICSYLDNRCTELENIQLHNVSFYRKGITIFDHNCYCLKIKKTLSPIVLGEENRFMTGSILIFTEDDFRTIFCGKVARSDHVEDWQQILVSFEGCPRISLNLDYLMVEYGVFFEPYYNVLKVLQEIKNNNFPMPSYLIQAHPNVSIPRYQRGYRYVQRSDLELNDCQLGALNVALSREFVIIQGPPGTGKTFVAHKITEALLQLSSLWCSRTPLLVISYTNHALDQFLEGISEKTVNILRLGGQSKNPKMKQFSLPEVRKKFYNTQEGIAMKKDFGKYYKEFMSVERDIKDLEYYLDVLQSGQDTTVIPNYSTICDNVTRIATSFYNKGTYCGTWARYLEILISQAKGIYQRYAAKQKANDIQIMRTVKVIGMTTTCASRMRQTLEGLKCPIVIIEEAAEVLESHIISVLTEHCQHLIMIGDHLQLQPSTADYKIETDYKLGVSLFERMVNNGMPYHTLNVQHRMRPEISALITPSIYPVLFDHDSVKRFPRVRGVVSPVFFIDHKELEDSAGVSSKENRHESEFFLQLAMYLLQNQYKPEEITILAGYNGQVSALSELAKRFPATKGITITSVDNFQGDESKIVLLSLVRNNKERKIGFLKKENRVCVALSRAKEGLFIMGNMTHLAARSTLWKKIQRTLKSMNAIRRELPLVCRQHKTVTNVKTPKDFKTKVKNGGCKKICREMLICRHICRMMCHGHDNHESNCDC